MMTQKSSRPLSCAFATGHTRWRNGMIRAKYAAMRLQGAVYPDVYCIPLWIGARCRFVHYQASVSADRYDIIFAELNAGPGQLKNLLNIIGAHQGKVVVLPGPGEVFSANAGNSARQRARRVLNEADLVLAYSPETRSFADDLAGAEVARVMPWPFDYGAVRRIAGKTSKHNPGRIRVLLGAPLRFDGIADNDPARLERCVVEALATLSGADRTRFDFHGFVYTTRDARLWRETGFGRAVNITLERTRGYKPFIRFMASCDAVISLAAVTALGRNTFMAAALGKPGIFSRRAALGRKLYPAALVESPDDAALPGMLAALFADLAAGEIGKSFLPDDAAARAVGDYCKNAEAMRRLLDLSSNDATRIER